MNSEIVALLLTYLLNLPFGYWRSKTKKMSKEWFASVHLPVPIIVLIRVLANAPLSHIPMFFVAFFLGQFTGGKIGAKRS